MKAPRDWRYLEVVNGRSPRGKPWKGLHGEVRTDYPTPEEWAALARYTKLNRYGVDHRTSMEHAYGRDDCESESLLQSWMLDGLLVVG